MCCGGFHLLSLGRNKITAVWVSTTEGIGTPKRTSGSEYSGRAPEPSRMSSTATNVEREKRKHDADGILP